MIPFNDFSKEPEELKKEIQQAIQRVVDSGWFILGKELEAFELAFAQYIGTRYCVGVASGTEAIALALMANNIGMGDEVITTNITAYPTITGILQAGAHPVVVDILDSNGLIDTSRIEEKITARTEAIVPVHLYGQSCNLDAIKALADRNNLLIIEDCAQACGATFKDKKCGSMGNCGAFSFYPTKNLGAYGDGGAITTNDEAVYKKLLALRNYGQTKRYYHDSKGLNSRLDEIQAAILNVKLKYLDQFNRERQAIAQAYRNGLQRVECLSQESYGMPCYHLFVIKSPYRDQLAEYLAEHGIQTLIHYPVPVNRQKAFKWQKEETMENSVEFADSILSLPIYPGLPKEHIDQIIQTINEFKP
ncbi:MAG: DegT/DnrJ/EryC1/StrS family aminotransferase [Methylococcaceae bacterium]|nr:DegT/DnrJ/EryC1/StrS family aminotransferase [Prolixibacteraceae bacterium]